MGKDYDNLRDLWYSWLFSRLHAFITENIIKSNNPKKVLDVGCGTGFQSILHAYAGSEVFGIDIANKLIEIAKDKTKYMDKSPLILFPIYYSYVKKYNIFINKILRNIKQKPLSLKQPNFRIADATSLPFKDNLFDHINCCGSVLNFIPNYKEAINEISRVLKPNGTFVIEVDMRWNLDVFWTVLDGLIKGKIGLSNNIWEGLKLIFRKPSENVKIRFPFGEKKKPINMDLVLFTKKSFINHLKEKNLIIEQSWPIHSITNIIPSVYLDSFRPSPFLKKLFQVLAKIEEVLYFFPGCSQVFFGKKYSNGEMYFPFNHNLTSTEFKIDKTSYIIKSHPN